MSLAFHFFGILGKYLLNSSKGYIQFLFDIGKGSLQALVDDVITHPVSHFGCIINGFIGINPRFTASLTSVSVTFDN